MCGPDSSVDIVTDYGLDGPGIESQWSEIFRPSRPALGPIQTGPGAHPASCTMGTGSFPGVKCGRGVLLTTHLLLVPPLWKGRAIPLPTLWATTGSVTGTLYLFYNKDVDVLDSNLVRVIGLTFPLFSSASLTEFLDRTTVSPEVRFTVSF